jgi:stage IV sporulation protein FB
VSFSLCGVRFRISLPFTALLTLFFLIDQTGLATLSVLTVLLHEGAHLLAMAACGVRPQSIRLVVGAVEIVAPITGLSRRKEVFVSAAGPAANLLAGGVLYLLWCREGGSMVQNAVILQFCFGFFNLLPAAGLDGGSILAALCGGRFDRLPGVVSVLTLMLLASGGVILFCRYGGAGVLFAAVYLLITGLLCARRPPERRKFSAF